MGSATWDVRPAGKEIGESFWQWSSSHWPATVKLFLTWIFFPSVPSNEHHVCRRSRISPFPEYARACLVKNSTQSTGTASQSILGLPIDPRTRSILINLGSSNMDQPSAEVREDSRSSWTQVRHFWGTNLDSSCHLGPSRLAQLPLKQVTQLQKIIPECN